MSDFVRNALEDSLNANISAVRAAGFDVAIESDADTGKVSYVSVINRIALPALPGPGAETQTVTLPPEDPTEREPGKKANATGRSGGRAPAPLKGESRVCRICEKKQLRGSNTTGVCSTYACQKQLKEAGEKH